MASLMKDDVKDEVSNETSKILIFFDGVINWDGVLKSGGKPKGGYAMHFCGWMKKIITHNSIWKCPCANVKIKGGPMM